MSPLRLVSIMPKSQTGHDFYQQHEITRIEGIAYGETDEAIWAVVSIAHVNDPTEYFMDFLFYKHIFSFEFS